MKLFPKRYLQCVTGGDAPVNVYYRADLLQANIASAVKPLLFYALDDVSGIANIGSLNGDAYNPRWDQGTGRFDCPLYPLGSTQRPLLMSLRPADSPILRVVHNLNLPLDPGFTVMVWFKKSSPSVTNVPILDSTWGNEVNFAWHIWVFPASNNLYWYYAPQGIDAAGLYDQLGWNQMTMRVLNNKVVGNLNGREVGSLNVAGNFGDRLTIGRRQHTGDPYNANPFDGCLSHVIVFNKFLSNDEVALYSGLLQDDLF